VRAGPARSRRLRRLCRTAPAVPDCAGCAGLRLLCRTAPAVPARTIFFPWEQLSAGLSGGVARALAHSPVGAIACRLAEEEATESP